MIYLVEDKATGRFEFCKSVFVIITEFPEIQSKYSTIKLRFSKLKKEGKPLIIREWGFIIYKAETIKAVKRMRTSNTKPYFNKKDV